MDKFAIDVQRIANSGPDDPHSIAVRSGDVAFTRLLRHGQDQLDDYLHAPPSQLAFWLVDNWWRLRYECVPPGIPSAEWRLAHEMASIGGGYVWPRLSIWGEGARVGLASTSDPPGVVGPVRYISDALLFIAATDFEDATDAFLKLAVDDSLGFGSDRAALKTQVEALSAERHDPELASWRRLEAQLGFDPDTAPDDLMRSLARLSKIHGEEGVEEAVQAHPGIAAQVFLVKGWHSHKKNSRRQLRRRNTGQFSGVLGNVASSNIQVGSYNSIHSELKRLGVPQEERNELETILDGLSKTSGESRLAFGKARSCVSRPQWG